MGVQFTNNAVTVLAAGVNIGDTVLSVEDGTSFPILDVNGNTSYCFVTVSNEIVKVIAKNSNTFTLEVGVKQQHAVGASVELRNTAEGLNALKVEARDNIIGSIGINVNSEGIGPVDHTISVDASIATKVDLLNHSTDTSNPHQVTKGDVGLDLVANSTLSDSYTTNSSNTYASSKAIYDGLRGHDTQHDSRFLKLSGGTLIGGLVLKTANPALSLDNGTKVVSHDGGDNLVFGDVSTTCNDIYVNARSQVHLLSYNGGAYDGVVLAGRYFNPKTTNAMHLGSSNHVWNSFHVGQMILSTSGIAVSSNNTEDVGSSNYYFAEMYARYFNEISDIRKKEVSEFDDASWIYDIEPIKYIFKEDKEKNKIMSNYGFSAQDVQSKLPDKSVSVVQHDSEEDSWVMSYTGFIAPMVKVIQEQKVMIDKLEARLTALENK